LSVGLLSSAVPLRLLPTPRAMVAAALMLAAPGVLGWGVSMSNGFGESLGSALLIMCAAAACLAVILMGPVACLIAVSAVQIVGFMPVLMSIGRVDLTLADVFYAGLVGWWLTRLALDRRQPDSRREVWPGEWAVILFLAYIGVTTLSVHLSEPELFATSAVSWIRLVQTASLAWLAASVIQTVRELRLLITTLALAATASIGLAVGEALLSGVHLSGRYGGLLGPNALGLVSGLLIMMAVVAGGGRRMSHRVALGAIGLLGLVMSKSQGALVGTALVVALALATTGAYSRSGAWGVRATVKRLNRSVLAAACAGVVVVAGILLLRPESIPTSSKFHESTVYHRIILGTGGLEIFSQHPLLGVGWRRSDSPAVIASADVAAKLRRSFSTPTETFYPDTQITSVHNTYVQLLAELGLVGATLFGLAVWGVGRRVLAYLRNLQRGSGAWRQARFFPFGALLSLIWLNDNPLYGGQPETVLLAVTLGSLFALARLGTAETAGLAAATEAPQATGRRRASTFGVPDYGARLPVKVDGDERLPGQVVPADAGFDSPRPAPEAERQPSRLEIAELEAELALHALRGLVGEIQRTDDGSDEKVYEPSSTIDAASRAVGAEEPSPIEPVTKRRGLLRGRGRRRAR
jgi:O-antigen ligase